MGSGADDQEKKRGAMATNLVEPRSFYESLVPVPSRLSLRFGPQPLGL